LAKQRNRQTASAGASPGSAPAALRDRIPDGLLRWLGFALALWVLLAVLYPGPVFDGRVFGSSDAGNAAVFQKVGEASLADGHYPLWNPYLFAGMPTFGSLAYVRFLYPPTEFFNFLQNSMGFVPLTWMLTHLLFGGLGMVWLLSRWKLPAAALLLGAAVWLLLPKTVAWGVHGHGSKLVAAMYLPWIVGWALRILDGRGALALGMTGLLVGLQFLSGHVQISYYTLLAVGWLGLWYTLAPFDGVPARVAVRWKRFGGVILGLMLGFALAAIMLVPVHGYAGLSIRGQDTEGGGGVGLDYATGWSLAPVETGTFILPSVAGFGKATYMGLMPFNDYPNYFGLLLLSVASAAFWRRESRSVAVALGVMALLGVLVSFGGFGFGFYELLYAVLPYFNKFRIPSMILMLTGFALAVMAARGAGGMQEKIPAPVSPWLVPALLGAVGLLLLLGGVTELARGPFASGLASLAGRAGRQVVPVLVDEAWALHRADLIRIGLILAAGAAALWYATRNEVFRIRGLVWVLALLIAVDLMAVDRRIVYPEKSLHQVGRDSSGSARLVSATPMERDYVPDTESGPGPGAAQLAAAVGHGRVWPLGSMGGRNLWMADGIRSLGGYHPAKLAHYEPIRKQLFSPRPAGRLAAWLSAGVVVYETTFNEAELSTLAGLGVDLDPVPVQAGPLTLYRNRAALPRARLLSAWRPVDSLPAKDALEPFLDAVQAGEIDVARVVHLDRTPDPEPGPVEEILPEPVFVRDALDEVELTVNSPSPALLLLADMMAPGWTVTVDGESAEILTADLVLRAVALEAGPHTVVFRYRDPSVRSGLTLTLVGLVLTVGLMATPLVRRFRRREPGEHSTDE